YVELVGSEHRHVPKLPRCSINAPRRHVPGEQFCPNRFRPRQCVCVCRERHWRHSVLHVATAAAIAKHRKGIVVVGVFRRDGLVRCQLRSTDKQNSDDARTEQETAMVAHGYRLSRTDATRLFSAAVNAAWAASI